MADEQKKGDTKGASGSEVTAADLLTLWGGGGGGGGGDGSKAASSGISQGAGQTPKAQLPAPVPAQPQARQAPSTPPTQVPLQPSQKLPTVVPAQAGLLTPSPAAPQPAPVPSSLPLGTTQLPMPPSVRPPQPAVSPVQTPVAYPPAQPPAAPAKPPVPPSPPARSIPQTPPPPPPTPATRPQPVQPKADTLPWLPKDTPSAPRPTPPPSPKLEEKAEPRKPEPKKELKVEPALPQEKIEKKAPAHSPLTPTIEAEVLDSQGHPIEEEESPFIVQLRDFLEELNLSPRHIITFFILIGLLIALFFGGRFAWRWYKGYQARAPEQQEQVSPSPTQEPTSEQTEKVPTVTFDDTGITATVGVAENTVIPRERVGDTGLGATIFIGRTQQQFADIAAYIALLRRMQNAYAANIDELLDKATDRRARLKSHISVLSRLHEDGTKFIEKMATEADDIRKKYDELRGKQQSLDENFFEQVGLYNAQTASDLLGDAIETGRDVTALRARFNALRRIQQFYAQALPKIAARVRDLELNQDALVAGIKVYDIKGSDVDLVVPVNGGDTSASQNAAPEPSATPNVKLPTISDENRPRSGTSSGFGGLPGVRLDPRAGQGTADFVR